MSPSEAIPPPLLGPSRAGDDGVRALVRGLAPPGYPPASLPGLRGGA
jgi:hypothetical protein